MEDKSETSGEIQIPQNRIINLVYAHPFLVCVVLFIIAQFFRWIDTFVFRLDEKIGELILTKSLGFCLVLVFLVLVGKGVKDIGLHGRKLGLCLVIGVVPTILGFIVGYGVDYFLAIRQGSEPVFLLGAIDPKMGVSGGFLFALFLLFGNFINSFMEEGLFRGVMGRLSRIRLGVLGTNLFTAFMFGIWHLPWVLKYYQLGQISTAGEVVSSIIFNTFPQFLIGLVYGYLYLKTGSLWAPWLAHTISNSTGNFLHINTTAGLDPNVPLRMMTYLGVLFLSLFWVRYIAEKTHLEEVEAWTA